ncbi:MAG: hypothetical protein JSV96_04075 [Candidatus Aminicenantes bacterium]|nr:MAG: hypothetical protein JSV96_04075 [Candidatus Aminicenantes bacterium]
MFEVLFELLLDFLGFIGLRKKKKEKIELPSLKTNDSTPKEDTYQEVKREGVSVCAGCARLLEKGAIYEFGKPWCTECYKTHVLKIKG